MKNKIWFLLIIILAVMICIAIYFGVKSRENNTNSNYDTSRTSTNNENSNNEGNTSNTDDENRKNNENEMKKIIILVKKTKKIVNHNIKKNNYLHFLLKFILKTRKDKTI